ncbi:ATP-binding protein [Streptomyces sp. 4N124]|uniref:ATP-binding protein n=1 Tax=Streptomyces sp. 4N124 TaxID=3457420 RepID=UPI003FD0632F
MTGPRWLRGLRARLLVAFVLVTAVGAAVAAWSGARSASSALVASSEQRFTETVTGRVEAVAPELTYPPDQDALDRLRAAVGPDTLVTYRDLRSVDGPADGLVTDATRSAVNADDRLVTQRIKTDGRTRLLVGMPVLTTAPDGTRTPSGIEVYAVRDLGGIERQIDDLTGSAARTAALALPLAALLALLAARSVLRPVRELRDTARRLADGDLAARSPRVGADELAQLSGTVNEMAESLQQSMNAMERMQADAKRFAADVSHELRTPLSTLTAVVEVLATTADDALDPDAQESAQLAIDETYRLVRLVEDLMEVSRFDAGTARLRMEDVDLAATVRDCLRARGWLDQVDVVTPEQICLRVDRRRVDVVMANLVGNALRHGGPPVRVHLAADSGHVTATVTDAGPGLPEDVLPHVFNRFYKADTARSRTPSSGLGLAIARENARLHGGDLTAGSTAEGGACFVLTLPRNREEP